MAALAFWLVLVGLPSSAKVPARAAAQNAADNVTPNLVNNYRVTNLVSDIPAVGLFVDPNLVNPWGLTFSATSPFWSSNNATGTATLYAGDVSGSPLTKNPLTVTIPGGKNTGVVFNGSSDFVITDGSGTSAARFIFATEAGTIAAWRAGTVAITKVTTANAIYKGLAIGNNGTANFLYAANFHSGKIDVFDKNFASATLAGTFTDPTLPAGYAPFNIQNLGGKLYVAYALQDAAKEDDVPGPGNGYISIFDTNGNFQQRLVSNGPLNSPWGLAISPSTFGIFPGALLVGNFGDGRINVFNPTTGAFLGTLNDEGGNPIEIDELWAITFGNGVAAGDTGSLYFTSGIGEEVHGIFGKIQPSSPAATLIQFSSATYSTNESANATITATRTGDLTQTASVHYATYDEAGAGNASQASDYILASGTLTFAPGDASKSFTVIVNDDTFVEGDETVHLILSNAVNAGLSAPNLAELTIHDNDTVSAVIPVQRTFVASLNGAQEVPPKVTTGKGLGIVLLANDELSAQVSLFFTGLTSNANGAHIHGPAAPGTNANIIFPFSNVPAATSGSVNNVTINPTTAQVADLKNGLDYFNVHTVNNSGGEIRGQILFNAIDEASYFVRQNYRDFLNREPDSGGLSFWTGQISTVCGADARCISRRRVDVSAAFFFSQEFQQTAFYVYRVRKAALGVQPTYSQFVDDHNQLPTTSDADKRAFTESFVQRGDFLAAYPTSLSGSDFIDKLILTIKNNSGVDLTSKKPELANEYIQEVTQTASRARVLRKIIEYPEFVNAEFNPAFVLVEYFDYLRRDPDTGGYNFWLNVLNTQVPGNFRSMVCAFETSAEYQQRFGPTVTRFNTECDPAIIGQ
ncbi:MAG: TIGR03118 family protein [Acidobacteria bacterium 13_1_20CM_3_53_8]|nr:MAG: TIGR03118 family protein [Acidobacteria bacterium 13_1_20CM_3_53_8]